MSEQQSSKHPSAQGMSQLEIDQRVFDLYYEYCHVRIDRREFLSRAATIAVAGGTGLAMAEAPLPRYAQAQQISFTDQRIKANYVTYPAFESALKAAGVPYQVEILGCDRVASMLESQQSE